MGLISGLKSLGKGAVKYGTGYDIDEGEWSPTNVGGVGMLKDAYGETFGKMAGDKRKAAEKGARSYGELGGNLWNLYGTAGQQQLGALGKAQGIATANAGDLGRAGFLETFYKDNAARQGQLGWAMDQAARANADAMSARGINSSTVAGEYENRARQGLLGDYLANEGALAGGADAAMRARLGQRFGEQFGVSREQSGVIGKTAENQGEALMDTEKNRIAAQMMADGADAEAIAAALGWTTDAAKAFIAAAKGG